MHPDDPAEERLVRVLHTPLTGSQVDALQQRIETVVVQPGPSAARLGRRRPGRAVVGLLVAAIVLVGSAGAAQRASDTGRQPVQGDPPTVGRMPSNPSEPMPDFIPVAARDGDGIAGYVATRDLEPDGSVPWWYQDPPVPVYAEDLHTLVGFMFEGKGFVPVGVDPAAVSNVGVSPAASVSPVASVGPTVVLYVRPSSTATSWFEVLPTTDPPQSVGFSDDPGVACLAFPAGSRLVLLDRSPADPAAKEVRTIAVAGAAEAEPTWVVIGPNGDVSVGSGKPTWWPGGPATC